eukprot:4404095-Amphidinium_carterae.1
MQTTLGDLQPALRRCSKPPKNNVQVLRCMLCCPVVNAWKCWCTQDMCMHVAGPCWKGNAAARYTGLPRSVPLHEVCSLRESGKHVRNLLTSPPGKLGSEVDGLMEQYDPRVSTTFDVVHQVLLSC